MQALENFLEQDSETIRMRYIGPIDPQTGIFGVRVRQRGRKQSIYLQFNPECDVPIDVLDELASRGIRLRPVNPGQKVDALAAVKALAKSSKRVSREPEGNLPTFDPLPPLTPEMTDGYQPPVGSIETLVSAMVKDTDIKDASQVADALASLEAAALASVQAEGKTTRTRKTKAEAEG